MTLKEAKPVGSDDAIALLETHEEKQSPLVTDPSEPQLRTNISNFSVLQIHPEYVIPM